MKGGAVVEEFLRWSKSYLECSFKGGDLERLFNMCRNHGIECWDMSYKNGVCYCCIYVKDFKKMRSFIRKTRVKIRIIKRHGLAFLITFLQKRKGLLVGLCMCIFILIMLTSCIWKVEFYGNSFYTVERLTKHLIENENIHYGIWKEKIDGALIEENLRLAFPDISWVSVRVEGTSLIINIEEMVKYETNKEEESSNYICAETGGEIVYMVTRSGTPYVTIGDVVGEGDLLIDGTMALYDDAMNVIENRMVGADGDIWARVVKIYDKVYYFEKISAKYDRPLYRWICSIGDKKISFGAAPKKSDNEKRFFHITEINSPLPGIHIQMDTYRPYEIVASLEAATNAKQQAEDEMSDLFDEFYEKGVQILENNVRILVYEDRIEAKGELVLIQPIGKSMNNLPEHTQIVENGETHEYNGNND